MKFNLNPLIFSETNADEVTRQWLIDNLETLNKQHHYQCFALEHDKEIGLDDKIKDLEKQLTIIREEYKNAIFIEKTIDDIKRRETLRLLGNLSATLPPTLTTEQLIQIAERRFPENNIRTQIIIHETAFREKINSVLKYEKPKALLLELLKKVKSLGMKYTGLDENLEKQHSLLGSGVITNAEFDTKVVTGNSTLAKRLAINAKIHNGGIICLMGAPSSQHYYRTA